MSDRHPDSPDMKATRLTCCLFASLLQLAAINTPRAEPVYHPSGARLTFGGMTHRTLSVSDMGNPALAATTADADSRYSLGLAVGGGIEYDGNDNLFRLLDELGADDGLAPPAGGGGGGSGGSGGGILDGLESIGIDVNNPDFQALIDDIQQRAIGLAVFVASVMTSVNAKAFVSADAPVMISNDFLGGTWQFEANYSLSTNLRGIHDPIEFDADAALASLEAAYNKSKVAGSSQTFDLTGGASVTVNPDGSTKFRFQNDSATITRAAEVTEFSIGYSRKLWHNDKQAVFVGIKPRLYDVGLSNTAIPVADIHNARAIFDALDEAHFRHEQGLGVDLGVALRGRQYLLGATVTHLNQPSFHFPAADVSGFSDPAIIRAIRERETWTLERQLKFEAGYISAGGAFGINLGLDANPVPDPMGDDYQWASLGAGFASDSWWLPSARLGVRKNLAGSELTYVTAGVTLFDLLNLDLASTTQTVVVSGRTLPRSLILNLSMQLVF